jgi:hypothetical protein
MQCRKVEGKVEEVVRGRGIASIAKGGMEEVANEH